MLPPIDREALVRLFRPRIALSALLAMFTAAPASAALLDFEGLGLAEGTLLATHALYPGVTFTNAMVVLPGNPRFAFNGNSSGSGAGGIDHCGSGASFAYPNEAFGTTTIAFSGPVTGVAVELLDIEVASATESMQIRVYDSAVGGSLLHSVTVIGGDPGTGDGLRTPVSLSGFSGDANILRLEFQKLSGPTGGTQPGMAIDNLQFTDAVTPAAASSWGRVKARYSR